jgi:hypothetical protein
MGLYHLIFKIRFCNAIKTVKITFGCITNPAHLNFPKPEISLGGMAVWHYF